MAQRATSLVPKPSLFFCFGFFLFFFLVFVFLGQVRWPKGPPHLALNPPYFLFVFFGFCFFFALLSLFFNWQKPVFPPRKGHFCLFSMFLFLSPLTFFGLPLFLFLFLCLSVSLVFLSSFLSFFFAFFLFLVFVSFSFFFLLCFCFMKRTTWTFSIAISFFPEIVSLSFGFLSCFSVSNPFFLSLLFPDFKLCFLFNINVFSFKKNKLKSTKKTKKKQIATKRFFLWTCVLQNVKSYLFFAFFAKFWFMFKKHYKIGISAHF